MAMGTSGSLRGLEGKVYLYEIKLDRQGYDKRGVYWGAGAPLFCAETQRGGYYYVLRARDRAAAKAKLLAEKPTLTFFR